MDYKIWVDLDGVLANWHQAACDCFGIEYPTNTVLHREWLAEQTQEAVPTILERLDRHPRFWEDMQPLPIFPQMITYLDTTFPDWGILTKATLSTPSWAGKAAWVRRYLGDRGMHRLVITGGPKHRLASPDAVLIDDTQYQIEAWIRAGGKAFRWREYTADCVEAHQTQFEALQNCLTRYRSTKK
jgi:hypothetical protein